MTCQTCIMAEGKERPYDVWCILRKMHYPQRHNCHAWCHQVCTHKEAMEIYEKFTAAAVAVMQCGGIKWDEETDLLRLVEARAIMRKKARKETP